MSACMKEGEIHLVCVRFHSLVRDIQRCTLVEIREDRAKVEDVLGPLRHFGNTNKLADTILTLSSVSSDSFPHSLTLRGRHQINGL